jgi:tRNA1Val (adenine37-N6)-methyltransferase
MLASLEKTTEDYILGLKILQKRDGHRLSIDPILLTSFTLPYIKKNDNVIDIGTGFGIIPLLISKRKKGVKIVGVEIQKDLVLLAEENLRINKLKQNIKIIEGDYREFKERFKTEKFDIVLSNPPFREPSSGRISPKQERAIARHEFHGSMEELVKVSKYVVTPAGRICFVYPIRRFVELLSCLKDNGLTPRRVRFVHHKKDSEGELFMVEARKTGKATLEVEKPLILENMSVEDIMGENV